MKDNTAIPSWLETPPLSKVNPPVKTRPQELPLNELPWEDFEKLCLCLARLEANVEHCQLYGERGQEQEGIDLYARQVQSKKYIVYQCKRVKNFGPSKIEKAVSKFLEGEWTDKTERLVLCTSESLISKQRSDEIEKQDAFLKSKKGISLIPWDYNQISLKLKQLPEIVDDFFGREWVKLFCGEDQAMLLGNRLDSEKIIEFRNKFAEFYRHVFNTHDPGLPIDAFDRSNVLSLENRYVIPDVYVRRSGSTYYLTEASDPKSFTDGYEDRLLYGDKKFYHNQQRSDYQRSEIYRHRQPVENWLANHDRYIILGGPGSGKSSLLRFLSLDLLKESPLLSIVAKKWARFLPVWVPFPLWTKLISNHSTTNCSLSQVLYSFLESWDEARLYPLLEQSLEDKRLLLLIDGLDEWKNESAARIALDRLIVFIEQRKLPAIITSRPNGFERLGMGETGWQSGELSDFSISQQKQLSNIWFKFKIKNIYAEHAPAEHEIERKASNETQSFLTELNRVNDIREIAKIPLLLCLLIFHKSHNVRLPQTRFKAFDSIIEHLISIHPKKRKKAALLTDDISSELSDDDIKKIIARLAYHVHKHFGEGIIEDEEAHAVVESYLKDCDYGYGFDQRESRKYRKEIFDITEKTIGLIVRRSPEEIGFFHRVFQEYLAAFYISHLSLDKQISIVETYCTNPQWKETILGLFHFTNRAEDIREFVKYIEDKTNSYSSLDRYTTDLLLSEIAFGDFNCPVALSRDLAQNTFEQIETGSWLPHRQRLLHNVIDGLRSAKVKELVKSKLKTWFPCRKKWRDNIFQAMAKWPKTPELIECLWKGIFDEDIVNQRAAAKALAELAGDDKDIANRIASLALKATDPGIRAVATEALLLGWPEHEDINVILDSHRYSISPELRLISIIGRIKLCKQTEEDQDEMLWLGCSEAELDYHWRDEVATALINGWSKSSKIKDACLISVKERVYNSEKIDESLAYKILLSGYPQDKDVVQLCIDEINTNNEFPFISFHHHHEAWRLLSRNFKDHPQLVETIDEWILKQQRFNTPEISMAALVGRTSTAKSKLISLLNSDVPHWPVRRMGYG